MRVVVFFCNASFFYLLFVLHLDLCVIIVFDFESVLHISPHVFEFVFCCVVLGLRISYIFILVF